MQKARMFFMVVLMVGVGRVVVGDEHAGHQHGHEAEEQARRDRLHMAVQQICPVSGKRLGTHGDPIKVTVGEHKEEVFLCCKGCLKGTIDAEHWATIHANFAQAQRICPVMENELPQNPKWTVVAGQIIYVCCPPCTKKIAASPAKYLKKLDELYTASLRTARQQR